MRIVITVVLIGLLLFTVSGIAISAIGSSKAETDISVASDGINQFSTDLYKKFSSSEKGNIFFSPYSISTALAMTYAGARGTTAEEMAKVLHFSLKPERLHKAYKSLTTSLEEQGKKGKFALSVANRLWGQKGFKFLDSFKKDTKTFYGAELKEMDFKKQAEKCREIINKWIEDKTNNKIKDLIAPRVLNKNTSLVLTNAIYFKGIWKMQFEKKQTKEAPFDTDTGKKVQVPMMTITGDFKYANMENIQILEMTYAGESISMIIFLPSKTDQLPQFEKTLDAVNLKKMISALKVEKVQVFIPRFKITCTYGLADYFRSMGMKLCFSDIADFSGMTGTKDMKISAIIHKAFVDVNEKGTEAAAATAVSMVDVSSIEPQIKVFRADHPFIFLIRDRNSNAILFMGRVADPSK